ncbi:hypothetical protein PFICI_07963 [Pestalotiopsis fici W106-1]|uniref:Uncharacterized protein n=1 Tax=Pestalotiopsis fici (strain W106-1 / CGMCC3.15140) TaxID=1229662 RepID=W3X351_PESFW|nr:uncharacterized protein PFICI_07963 [Pestalotiopsis fici W106-1]ETS80434.1 hypothetical protein PFICI_07963 [Pestalotiopsis fici W106-1]
MDRRDEIRPGEHARRVPPAVHNPHVEDEEDEDNLEEGVDDEDTPDTEEIIQIPSWTTDPKPPPFPFNLTTTTVCLISQLLLILINLETQHQLLVRYQVWRYLFAILPRVLLTTALAFASTALYEGILADFDGPLHDCWRALIIIPQSLLLRSVAAVWRINVRVPPTENKLEELERMTDVLRKGDGPWGFATGLYEVLATAWSVAVSFAVLLWYAAGRRLLVAGLLWALEGSGVWGGRWAIDFVNQDRMWVDASTVPEDLWTPRQRLIGQVALQLGVATALLQFMFMFRFQVQEAKEIYESPEMIAQVRPKAAYLRATAVHIVTYTAYQIIRGMLPVKLWEVGPGYIIKQEFVKSFRRKSFNQSCVTPGSTSWFDLRGGQCLDDFAWLVALSLSVLLTHQVLRYAMRRLARVGWWFCEPFFVWRTLWIAPVVARTRLIFLEQMDADFTLDETVEYRVLMTFIAPDSGPLPMMIPGGGDAEGVW